MELIIEKLFLLIKELLTKQENNENKSKTDNIFNLCHVFFISIIFIKNKLPFSQLSNRIKKYIPIFLLLCQRIKKQFQNLFQMLHR